MPWGTMAFFVLYTGLKYRFGGRLDIWGDGLRVIS